MENGVPRRNKGKAGEREAAKLWAKWFPDCKRIIGQARQGSESPDIGCAEMNKHFYVEVKRYKRITDGTLMRLWRKMWSDRERWIDAGGNGFAHPILMFRQDGEPWYVVHDDREVFPYEYMNDTGDAYTVYVCPWVEFAAALDRVHGKERV